ncbi:MAG: hypothetical protein FWH11_12035 [Micrococcales bacterium]|nr:hypothetical protein [Micrococcales bacterium]
MTGSTAALRTLRQKTGVGVMDAAKALKDAGGDLVAAAELLRERGLCDRPVVRYPQLEATVAVFTELGWSDATYDDVPTLLLGTPAQQRTALAGLRSGQWEERHRQSWMAWRGWARQETVDFIEVDPAMLWMFAVRLGIGARRAAQMASGVPEGPALAVLAARGPQFARTFIGHTSWMAVPLVAYHRLPVPDDRDYLSGWARSVQDALAETRVSSAQPSQLETSVADSRVKLSNPRQNSRTGEAVRDRFAEHVRAAVTAGLEVTGPLGRVLPAGVSRGWMDRAEAVGLVLAGLDAAARPVNRKAWLGIWLDGLHATDAEIVAQADALVPVLAAGDALVVERLAPVLIGQVDDALLADVATVAMTMSTKKALRVVLTALARRPRPSAETVETVGPQVMAIDVGHDRSLARAVQAVVDGWGLGEAADGPQTSVEGLWRPVPPVAAGATPLPVDDVADLLLARHLDGVDNYPGVAAIRR